MWSPNTFCKKVLVWYQIDPKANNLDGLSPYNSMANNPIIIVDPEGDWVHIVGGAIIGGVANTVIQGINGNINSIGDGFIAFGIGAAAGAIGTATGGAALTATEYGGFAGGAITGAADGRAGGFINGFGNALLLQDRDVDDAFERGLVEGTIGVGTGFIIGGGIGYFTAPKGTNPWNGKLIKPAGPSSSNMVIITKGGEKIEVPGLEVSKQQLLGGFDIKAAQKSGLYNGTVTSYNNVPPSTSTDFVSGVTAKPFGKVCGKGTINTGKTINSIRNGTLKPSGV